MGDRERQTKEREKQKERGGRKVMRERWDIEKDRKKKRERVRKREVGDR